MQYNINCFVFTFVHLQLATFQVHCSPPRMVEALCMLCRLQGGSVLLFYIRIVLQLAATYIRIYFTRIRMLRHTTLCDLVHGSHPFSFTTIFEICTRRNSVLIFITTRLSYPLLSQRVRTCFIRTQLYLNMQYKM